MKALTYLKLMKSVFLSLVFLVCELTSSEISRPRGVSVSRAPLYNPEKDFTCFDGTLTIPFTQVNDDYCDCPDASDEPGTSACPHGTFYCLNAGHQPINIPSNRVNDGICDCCDTSDEFASTAKCVNTCNELGRSAREKAQKIAELTKIGAQIRIELSQKGAQIKQEKKDKLLELEKNKEEAEKVLLEKENLKKAVEDEEYVALEYYRELERQRKEAEEANKKEEITEERSEAEEHTNIKENLDNEEEVLKKTDVDDHEEVEDLLNPDENLENRAEEEGENVEDEDEEEEEDPSSTLAAEQQQEEEEGDEEDVADHQVYDVETQKLVDRANEARKEFESARSAVEDIKREIDHIREYLDRDFGPEDEFAPLEGQCFEYEDREYIYKLCPFDKTIQQPKGKSGSSETRLGVWSKWDGPDYNKYQVMSFENGQNCWNGPDRSTRVRVSCGGENKLVSVTEPNRCEYQFEFSTPAACKEVAAGDSFDLHDEL